ncbi:filamentous hemagglutinin N-terminal domain-containing protein [Nostoc sp. PCC 7107]|uniref:two-partner secretion domain-containing protein n=1 Tax=Nostoc sp. PCC 7107 TaxID=317936 RepID=UPI00029F0D4B|nr:filamentous hemagglutinin N-terminal domain-containing protein [Nostoc sp. PCC 7107]AFY41246.1 filamentous hemagglutinin family outer membrane protein [Nostoc sp. PCC 7107]
MADRFPFLLVAPLVALGSFFCDAATAQITPDSTLGVESSTIRQETIQGINSDLITGGATRGANLFHSFSEFNIPAGRGAYFANPPAIQNILTRVTGGNPSNILGTLGVLGNANLFLINPNGISFGSTARLDIKGSFVAATADSLTFGNNLEFSATNPQAPPLLNVNIPIGLRFRENAGDIHNAGNLTVGKDLTLQAQNLNLSGIIQAGGNLTLQAQDTVTVRDSVEQPFIAAAGNQLLIQGNESVDIFALNHVNSGLFSGGDLVLRSANTVGGDAHYWSGGNFRIEQLDGSLGNLSSPHDPIIRTTGDVFIGAYEGASLHIIAGGSVTIPGFILITGADPQFGLVENITLSNGQQITIDGKSQPTLDIRAGVKPEFLGVPSMTESGNDFFLGLNLDSVTPINADINVGAILFSTSLFEGTKITGNVLLTNQYQPNLSLLGSINVANSLFPLFNEAIQTGSLELSNGGSITIDSRNNIGINGIIDAESFLRGGKILIKSGGDILITNATVSATGKEGNINIIGNDITIDNSILNTGVFQITGLEDERRTGKIKIIASGTLILNNESSIVDGIISASIVENSDTQVNSQIGNNIDIETRYLELNNSIISTLSLGIGSAGNIKIKATEAIKLESSSLFERSFISSRVSGLGSVGNAGSIVVETNMLELNNGSAIESTQDGRGNAGNINITATESIKSNGLLDENFITVGITSGLGQNGIGKSGDIQIVTKNLELVDNSQISAITFGRGDGGNINISADNIRLDNFSFITNSPSDISSQIGGITQIGNTGNIEIYAKSIEVINLSQIASNTLGVGDAGDIKITAEHNIMLEGGSFINSEVSTALLTEVIGNAGNIWITTPKLSVQNISGIFSQAQDTEGNAGNIEITTGELTLKGASRISSLTNSNQSKPGSIIINNGRNPTQFISLEESRITAEIGNNATLNPEITSNIEEININSNIINLFQGSTIRTLTAGGINASNVNISSASINLNQSSRIETLTNSNSSAGNIIINSKESVNIANSNSGLFAQTENTGNAGNITINTPIFNILNNAEVSAFTTGIGNAGSITINAPQRVDIGQGSRIVVETSGAGNPGDINITTNTLNIGEDAELSATARATATNRQGGNINLNTSNLNISGRLGIFAETQGISPAGNLTLNPNSINPILNINFTDNGFISASTTAVGNGGNINISAPEVIDIQGEGRIIVETSGSGNAGRIDITAQTLNLANGVEISASTNGTGNAGDILLTIQDNLNLTNSAIASSTTPNSTGNGGNIIIDPDQVNLNNRAQISVNSQGQGDAGSIFLTANNLTLNNSSTISAATASGEGGNINLNIANLLRLRNNSPITATANGTGNGGNININTTFLVANQDSDITANAFAGRGGNINITTQALFFSPDSQITASSELGVEGVVAINTPEIDPSQGLLNLPETVVDPRTLINQNACQRGRQSEFTITGRGGLPSSPEQFPNSDEVEVGLVTPSEESVTRVTSPLPTAVTSEKIVPAQGWVRNEKGRIILVGYDPSNANIQRQKTNLTACQPR